MADASAGSPGDPTNPEITGAWDALIAAEPARGRWLLLAAYVARVEVRERSGSPFRHELLEAARGIARRLLAQHGYAAAGSEPHAVGIIRQLLGGQEAIRALEAAGWYCAPVVRPTRSVPEQIKLLKGSRHAS